MPWVLIWCQTDTLEDLHWRGRAALRSAALTWSSRSGSTPSRLGARRVALPSHSRRLPLLVRKCGTPQFGT